MSTTENRGPLSVYVGGGSGDRAECAEWMDELRKAGVHITHDWTRCEGYGRESTATERATWAQRDIDGVRAADVVWIRIPREKSEGSHGELCAALALGKRVIVSGHYDAHGRIFPALCETAPDDIGAFARIVAAARSAR